MQTPDLTGGFDNVAQQSARAFRASLDVMARPGKISEISGATPPAPLSDAAGTLMLTLCDPQTPVWLAPTLDNDNIQQWLRFHTGAPITKTRDNALFAVGTWDELLPLAGFSVGTEQYPDRSATLIVEMDVLSASGTTLRGPGIQTSAEFGLPDIGEFQKNAALFPLGLDFFFTAGGKIAALPRTTKLEG